MPLRSSQTKPRGRQGRHHCRGSRLAASDEERGIGAAALHLPRIFLALAKQVVLRVGAHFSLPWSVFPVYSTYTTSTILVACVPLDFLGQPFLLVRGPAALGIYGRLLWAKAYPCVHPVTQPFPPSRPPRGAHKRRLQPLHPLPSRPSSTGKHKRTLVTPGHTVGRVLASHQKASTPGGKEGEAGTTTARTVFAMTVFCLLFIPFVLLLGWLAGIHMIKTYKGGTGFSHTHTLTLSLSLSLSLSSAFGISSPREVRPILSHTRTTARGHTFYTCIFPTLALKRPPSTLRCLHFPPLHVPTPWVEKRLLPAVSTCI